MRLTCEDTGVGLDPESVDKLFDAFYTTKPDGMGIGPLRQPLDHRESSRPALGGSRMTGPGATFAFSIPGGLQCAGRPPA